MDNDPHTKNVEAILYRFGEGYSLHDLILPFGEIAVDSNHLVLGYAGGEFTTRDALIP